LIVRLDRAGIIVRVVHRGSPSVCAGGVHRPSAASVPGGPLLTMVQLAPITLTCPREPWGVATQAAIRFAGCLVVREFLLDGRRLGYWRVRWRRRRRIATVGHLSCSGLSETPGRCDKIDQSRPGSNG
jgi:hypothetical protein